MFCVLCQAIIVSLLKHMNCVYYCTMLKFMVAQFLLILWLPDVPLCIVNFHRHRVIKLKLVSFYLSSIKELRESTKLYHIEPVKWTSYEN